MKAITLHQPYASLVALGVKVIETRSWPTAYRGRLAIHAGARWPDHGYLPALPKLSETDQYPGLHWMVIDTITDPAYQGPRPQGSRVPRRAQTPTLVRPATGPHGRRWDPEAGTSAIEQGTAHYLPLGAVVATCRLEDCLPILAGDEPTNHTPHVVPSRFENGRIVAAYPSTGTHDTGGEVGHHFEWDTTVYDGQAPFGDYTPGRYAWLLTDIEPLPEPVPARGHQGWWEWDAPVPV